MGLNWIITGGCGFIGRNIVRNLLDEGGHTIRLIDNLSTGTLDDLRSVCDLSEVEFMEGDILDKSFMMEAAQGRDAMVHLAANTGVGPSVEDPESDCRTNVIGTFNCLEAARFNRVKRFVFASSGAPAGEVEPPITEDLPPRPVSPYGASKLAGEGYCSAYFRSFGVETVALRFGNVYGEYSGHKESVVAKFIKRLMTGTPLEIYGDGSQTRDFIYIGDLVRAVRLAVSAPDAGGEIFQIATSMETTVQEIAEMLIARFRILRPDADCSVIYSEKRTGDVMRNFSDTSKAKKILSWQAQTALEDGIDKTIQWFLTQASQQQER